MNTYYYFNFFTNYELKSCLSLSQFFLLMYPSKVSLQQTLQATVAAMHFQSFFICRKLAPLKSSLILLPQITPYLLLKLLRQSASYAFPKYYFRSLVLQLGRVGKSNFAISHAFFIQLNVSFVMVVIQIFVNIKCTGSPFLDFSIAQAFEKYSMIFLQSSDNSKTSPSILALNDIRFDQSGQIYQYMSSRDQFK